MKKYKRNPGSVQSAILRRPYQRIFPLFLLPMFVSFCVGFIWPFAQGLFLSFTKFRTTSKWTWVGIENYIKAFTDESFRYSFGYTALFAVVSLILINVIAFAVALALTQKIKGANLFRTVFFMPNMIGGIVLGYIWSMIFDGLLSNYGKSILTDSTWGFWGLIILMCWQQVGYMMIIYIAGLQAVPEDMMEAAKIDGASHSQIFVRIMMPLTKSALISLAMLSFISCWNEYMAPLIFLAKKNLYTISQVIRWYMLDDLQRYDLNMAAATSAIVPILILFIFCQKYFVEGIATSGVKG